MSRRLLLLALVLITGFAPAPLPRPSRHGPPRNDLARLQGEWDVLERYYRGRLTMSPQTRVLIERDVMSVLSGGRMCRRYVVRINPGSPPSLDLIENGGGEDSLLAIYRLDGDHLIICYDPDERPTSFDVKQRCRVMVLRRR